MNPLESQYNKQEQPLVIQETGDATLSYEETQNAGPLFKEFAKNEEKNDVIDITKNQEFIPFQNEIITGFPVHKQAEVKAAIDRPFDYAQANIVAKRNREHGIV